MGKKRKLLIADDDRQVHGVFAEYFSKDFEVLHASDGADALMSAVEHVPEVMLLDIKMPMLDGRTVCMKIKNNPRTRDIKVIMVTGKGGEYDRMVGFEVGADEYLDKPLSLATLSRVVENLTG